MVAPSMCPKARTDPEQIRAYRQYGPDRMNPRWVWTDPDAFFNREDPDDLEFYRDLLQEQQEQM